MSIARTLITALLVVFASQALGAACTDTVSPPTPRRTFDVVERTVRAEYYGYETRKAELDELFERYRELTGPTTSEFDLYFRILSPMLDELGDSHNFAQPPVHVGAQSALQPQVTNSLPAADLSAGLGLSIGWVSHRGEPDYVFDVRRGSGAELAGIEPGSLVKRFQVWPTPTGGRAELAAIRPNGALHTYRFDFPAIRADPPRAAYDLPSGYRVIRFDEFNRESVEWFRKQLRQAPRGAIIDLRGNRGGLERSTTSMLGELLPANSIIGRSIENERTRMRQTTQWGASYRQPVAVLVGPESQSAAEVFAAALQHHGRAILVGKTTAGAVMTSRIYPLPDGGVLSLAVSDFVGPNGQRIEGAGVNPDVDAISTLSAVRAGRDLILEAAVAALSRAQPG